MLLYLLFLLVAYVVFSIALLLLGYISEMIDYLVMRYTEKRSEEERQRHDCTYCFYYKNGKCLTRYEKDCKSNDYFIWYPKENS